jgi:hypothetical protein
MGITEWKRDLNWFAKMLRRFQCWRNFVAKYQRDKRHEAWERRKERIRKFTSRA